MNALAASDYVMIPIMLSKQATARVPVLLKRLKQLKENVNPDLKVLGIVANRTQKAGLTADEKTRLNQLSPQCKDSWGRKCRCFKPRSVKASTFVRPRMRTARFFHPRRRSPFLRNSPRRWRNAYPTFAGPRTFAAVEKEAAQ